MSRNPCSSKSEHSHSADSTSASGVAFPYFSSSRLSSEPAFTPIRIGVPASEAARAISLTLSSNCLMLPGFTRTAAQPGVDRREHVLRLEMDVRDHRDLRLPRDRRQARPRRPASDTPPARSGSPTPSAPRSAAASRRCPTSGSSSSTAPTPARPRRPPPNRPGSCRLTLRSASLVGTDGIPREIAVICCATPRCGSRSRDRRAPAFEITARSRGTSTSDAAADPKCRAGTTCTERAPATPWTAAVRRS